MRQWLQIIKETSIGTTPAADSSNSIWIDIEETDPGITVTPSIYNVRSALPNRGVVNRISGSGSDAIAGNLSTKLYHEHADFWKEAVFVPSIRNTDEPYLPTYTITRVWRSNAWTARVEQYKRCQFQSVTLTGSNQPGQDPIAIDLTVIGGEYKDDASLSAPACTVFPTELYLWPMTELKLNNVSIRQHLKGWQLTINHAVTPSRSVERYPNFYTYGGWSPELSFTTDLNNHDFRAKYLSIRSSFSSAIYAADNMLELTYAVDKKITFPFYNAMFSVNNPQRPPGGEHTQASTILPHYDCTNLDMTCTVTNPE